MITGMRGTMTFLLLVATVFAVAGFFAQGMARFSRLPTNVPSVSSAPNALQAPQVPHAPHAPQAPKAAASKPIAAPDAPGAAPAPLPSPEPITPPLSPLPEAAPPQAHAVVPPPRLAPAPATSTVTPSASAAPLSAAEVHNAQCQSLRTYLSELDTMARAANNSGASMQAWIQNQRTTTRERQAELRC